MPKVKGLMLIDKWNRKVVDNLHTNTKHCVCRMVQQLLKLHVLLCKSKLIF